MCVCVYVCVCVLSALPHDVRTHAMRTRHTSFERPLRTVATP